MSKRLVVVGAGPMGVAAAAGALARGHDVTVLEAGEVGAALERWGPVRCFTPLSMNLPESLLRVLDGRVGRDAFLTGPEIQREVLQPLVAATPLATRVKTRHRVLAIGRRGLTRGDYAGHPLRGERPFLIQVETPDGEESIEADVVFDATGGYVLANAFGPGGLPARGERSNDCWVIRDHATLAAAPLGGKRVLLIGHGHSAANAILMLEASGAQVTWSVRVANRRPCVEVPNDPLPERDRVVSRANALAENPPEWLRMERRAVVESVTRVGSELHARLSGGREVAVDQIASFTGFRPDARHISELQVELSPVTEGGARLYRAISNVTDCLSVPAVKPQDLQTGEPNFFFVGARSYGRARTFLLQTGLAQMETILGSL